MRHPRIEPSTRFRCARTTDRKQSMLCAILIGRFLNYIKCEHNFCETTLVDTVQYIF